MDDSFDIAEDRALTSQEAHVIRWLLENGGPAARAHLPELDALRVVSRCPCGCASIDFVDLPHVGLKILSDYQWSSADGSLFGIFVFAMDGALAGLEVWAITEGDAPSALPAVGLLRPQL